MRSEMPKEMERTMTSCSTMKDIRNTATEQPAFKEAFDASLNPPKELLNSLFPELELKEQKFKVNSVTMIPAITIKM